MTSSRTLKVALGASGVTAAAFLVGFAAFVVSIMRYDNRAPADGDAVVVLTGGELRVREGFRIFTGGAGRRILISGVNRATTKPELQKLSGVQPILFDCCVDVDYAARDTVGNADETRTWLRTWGFRRLVVVTSNYHMPRSMLELRRALPGVELVPHAVVSTNYAPGQWWRHPAAVKRVLTEYVKFWPSAARYAISALRNNATSRSSSSVSPTPDVPPVLPRISGL